MPAPLAGETLGRFIARRLIQAIPTLFGVLLITFLLSRLSPADPVKLMLAGNSEVTVEDRQQLMNALGLNDPLPVQFAKWLWQLAPGSSRSPRRAWSRS